MRKLIIPLLAALALTACNTHNKTEEAIRYMVREHPQIAIQDVYKSFYQDSFGPGHMITDTAAMREYLQYELTVAAADTVPNPYYEPVGAQARYVRVCLRCVNEGLLTEEQLLDAFIRSAQPAKQPKQSWADEWTEIEQIARKIGVPCTDEESRLLMQAAQNNQAVHHSETYRNAYRPHYRIVRRDIFDKEINPFLYKHL